MSRRCSTRLAALLSAIALTLGAAVITTTGEATVAAGSCCTGHK